MVDVRVSLKLEASWDFFRRKKKNKQTKKPQELIWKFIEKRMKIHGTKVPWPATKEDKCCFFMIAKPLAESLSDSLVLHGASFTAHNKMTAVKKSICSNIIKMKLTEEKRY